MSSMIVSLNFGRSPSAVLWLVVAVIVYAVNAQLWAWPWSHIGKKVLELLPPFTDLNSSASITAPFLGLGILASKPHGIPNAIFWRLFAMPSASMFECGLPILAPIDGKAPAAFGVTATQRNAYNSEFFPAGASAIPNCGTVAIYECKG